MSDRHPSIKTNRGGLTARKLYVAAVAERILRLRTLHEKLYFAYLDMDPKKTAEVHELCGEIRAIGVSLYDEIDRNADGKP